LDVQPTNVFQLGGFVRKRDGFKMLHEAVLTSHCKDRSAVCLMCHGNVMESGQMHLKIK